MFHIFAALPAEQTPLFYIGRTECRKDRLRARAVDGQRYRDHPVIGLIGTGGLILGFGDAGRHGDDHSIRRTLRIIRRGGSDVFSVAGFQIITEPATGYSVCRYCSRIITAADVGHGHGIVAQLSALAEE